MYNLNFSSSIAASLRHRTISWPALKEVWKQKPWNASINFTSHITRDFLWNTNFLTKTFSGSTYLNNVCLRCRDILPGSQSSSRALDYLPLLHLRHKED